MVKAEDLIENINHYSVEKRLSQALLELLMKMGYKPEMSKKDLASNIGMSQGPEQEAISLSGVRNHRLKGA